MKYKVVYIAGPYRAANAWDREKNIRCAEELAFEVWKLGAAALCPHTNSRFFDGAIPDDEILDGCFALLRKSDAVLMTPNWRASEGATRERDFALKRRIPVFESLEDLEHYIGISW